MSTPVAIIATLAALAGGGMAAGGIALGRAVRDAVWRGYEVTIRIGPAAKPDAAVSQAVPAPVVPKQSKYANDDWRRRQRDRATGRFQAATAPLREASSS